MSDSLFLWDNLAGSTLASGCSNSTTVIALSSGTGALFPNPAAGQVFTITITSVVVPTNIEVVYCTARSGDVLTVARGQEGTTAQAFNAGDKVQQLLTAGGLASFVQWAQVGGASYGGVGGAGAFNFTVPPGVTALTVEAWGAGGGGGGSFGAGSAASSGGGGAYVRTLLTGLTPGTVMAGVIGAGGAGGTNGSSPGNGSAGGSTTFGGVSAGGGGAGVAANGDIQNLFGAAGGIASGGNLVQLGGQTGGFAFAVGSSIVSSVGGGTYGLYPPLYQYTSVAINGEGGLTGCGANGGTLGGIGGTGGNGLVLIQWG